MNSEQIHRYARHISLSAVGARGQERLLAARVAVNADGRPATHCALVYLAASGVGRIALQGADDRVTEGEVATSLLFKSGDVGVSRLEVYRRVLAELNPDVEVTRESGNASALSLPECESLAEGLESGCRVAAAVVVELSQGTS